MTINKKKNDNDFVFWVFVAVIMIGLIVAYGNRSKDPCPPEGCKPVPHSTISPEGVEDLP